MLVCDYCVSLTWRKQLCGFTGCDGSPTSLSPLARPQGRLFFISVFPCCRRCAKPGRAGKLPQALRYWIIPQIAVRGESVVHPQGWRAAAHASHRGGEGLKAGDKNGRLFARQAPSSGKLGCRQDQELIGGSQDLGLLSQLPSLHPCRLVSASPVFLMYPTSLPLGVGIELRVSGMLGERCTTELHSRFSVYLLS